MRIRGCLCVGLLGAGLFPAIASAQATGDQARLVFTVSGGVVAGRHLWSVAEQPVQITTPTDTFGLSRRIGSNIAIGFGGTYYPGENLGWAVEGFLVGLGFEDQCRHVFSSGSPDATAACRSIQGATKSATSVFLSAGPVVRFNSRKLVSPYARANLGLVFSNQSSLRTIGRIPRPQGTVDLIVYHDDHDSRVAPALALGAGLTFAIAKAYQLRWEMRDNIVGVQRVTGPTSVTGAIPPHKITYKHLFSVTIGFDVVLERRKGRRY